MNYWNKVENILAQLGLLKKAQKKWGRMLNKKEYQKALAYIEKHSPKEFYSELHQPMDWDTAGGYWHGYKFCQWARYGVRKVCHPGTDYNRGGGSQDLGLPVYAIADGVVTFKGWGTGWGWHMFVIHQLNHKRYGKIKCWSHYAHLQSQPVFAVGESVMCGQKIGEVGGTGGWTPHLHFELRKRPLGIGFFPYGKSKAWVRDNYYDPMEFLNLKRYSQSLCARKGA